MLNTIILNIRHEKFRDFSTRQGVSFINEVTYSVQHIIFIKMLSF